jgi:hypothetical protein
MKIIVETPHDDRRPLAFLGLIMVLCITQVQTIPSHGLGLDINKGYIDEDYMDMHCKGETGRQPSSTPPVPAEPS